MWLNTGVVSILTKKSGKWVGPSSPDIDKDYFLPKCEPYFNSSPMKTRIKKKLILPPVSTFTIEKPHAATVTRNASVAIAESKIKELFRAQDAIHKSRKAFMSEESFGRSVDQSSRQAALQYRYEVEVILNKYIVRTGHGQPLVRRCMKLRSWWTELNENDKKLPNFEWKQTSEGFSFARLNKSNYWRRCFNHFEFHEVISQKDQLYQNLQKLSGVDQTKLDFERKES
jgi:hypothetical protein